MALVACGLVDGRDLDISRNLDADFTDALHLPISNFELAHTFIWLAGIIVPNRVHLRVYIRIFLSAWSLRAHPIASPESSPSPSRLHHHP